ncbi:chemotaxis protein [Marichromatium purpuratum 984]|uniref:Chemotaxis protein n=1 Tax=Marichromatium purpuratum 984 TaxID=765910 RepID=W0E2J4_MARPU|nr:chemotaxis protein [Marichromatium purpuratum 984]
MVVFALGEQRFALPGARIGEILPLVPIHPVPGCPPALEGVISVRGEITSVLCLATLLGRPAPTPVTRGAILLASAREITSGLRVERVVDVVDIAGHDILEPPPTLPSMLARVTTGVFTAKAHTVALLDLERLFIDFMKESA